VESRKDSEYAGILLQASGGIGILKAYSILMRKGELSHLWGKSQSFVLFLGLMVLLIGGLLLLFGEFIKREKSRLVVPSVFFTLLMAVLWMCPAFFTGSLSSADVGFLLLLVGLIAWQVHLILRKNGQSDKGPDRRG